MTFFFTIHILTTFPSQGVMCSLRDWEERCLPATARRPARPLQQLNCHFVCVCVSRPNLYHKTTAASTVLDARGAPVLGVGGAQEEQGWRRCALCFSQDMCEPGVHVVRDSTHDQASLQLHESRKTSSAAGVLVLYVFFMLCVHHLRCFSSRQT